MIINTNTPFICDITDCVKLFGVDEISVKHTLSMENNIIKNAVTVDGNPYLFDFNYESKRDEIENKRMYKRFSKLAVYYALSSFFNKKMPWGALTGIRPSKLFFELGNSRVDIMRDVFMVSEQKINLLSDIFDCQKELLNSDENVADIYVSIPFCSSRCSYCSFFSCQAKKNEYLINEYIKCLKIEIEAVKGLVLSKGYKINCVYVGGGTPTAITANQLDEVLSSADFRCNEYTVEAGRADSIDKEKLDVILKGGANRISVNPQTFSDKTLELIGRNHTVKQFYDAYELSKKYNYKINLDLICGLPNENYDDFMLSLRKAIELEPDNITVHTLALKRGAEMKNQEYKCDDEMIAKTVSSSYDALKNERYKPYYMYRQKYVAQSLENVGYQRNDTPCRYNIDIMEENANIIAVGANAISKRVFLNEHRIERKANAKDIKTYINNIRKSIEDKEKLFLL